MAIRAPHRVDIDHAQHVRLHHRLAAEAYLALLHVPLRPAGKALAPHIAELHRLLALWTDLHAHTMPPRWILSQGGLGFSVNFPVPPASLRLSVPRLASLEFG